MTRSPVESRHRSDHDVRRRSVSADDKHGSSERHRSTEHSDKRKSVKQERRSPSESGSKRKKSKKKKSKKEKKKRQADTDSDASTSGSDDDIDDSSLRVRLQLEREQKKIDRKRDKEKMKGLETPEEKRARRLAKKLIKEQKRKQELGWGEDYIGYSNVDNPFGDAKLTDTFVWAKKLKKEGETDIRAEELERRTRQQIEANKGELEKYKKMREARESAKEENELMMREREAEQFQEWTKQEDVFHLNQARLRSKIRIKEARAKPIDLLARYITTEEDEDDMDIEMQEPYNYLNGLDRRDLEDLMEDIKVYLSLEGEKNADYWRDVATIAEEELNKLKRIGRYIFS